eukprot:jgi/Astpho2/5126/Aster-06337
MPHLCQSHSPHQTTGSWPPPDPKLTCIAGKLSIKMLATNQVVGGTISQVLARWQKFIWFARRLQRPSPLLSRHCSAPSASATVSGGCDILVITGLPSWMMLKALHAVMDFWMQWCSTIQGLNVKRTSLSHYQVPSAEYSSYIIHVISLGLADDYTAQLRASCSPNSPPSLRAAIDQACRHLSGVVDDLQPVPASAPGVHSLETLDQQNGAPVSDAAVGLAAAMPNTPEEEARILQLTQLINARHGAAKPQNTVQAAKSAAKLWRAEEDVLDRIIPGLTVLLRQAGMRCHPAHPLLAPLRAIDHLRQVFVQNASLRIDSYGDQWLRTIPPAANRLLRSAVGKQLRQETWDKHVAAEAVLSDRNLLFTNPTAFFFKTLGGKEATPLAPVVMLPQVPLSGVQPPASAEPIPWVPLASQASDGVTLPPQSLSALSASDERDSFLLEKQVWKLSEFQTVPEAFEAFSKISAVPSDFRRWHGSKKEARASSTAFSRFKNGLAAEVEPRQPWLPWEAPWLLFSEL